MAPFHTWEYRVPRVTVGPQVLGTEQSWVGSYSSEGCRRGASGLAPELFAHPRGARKLSTGVQGTGCRRGFGVPGAIQRAKTHR